MSMLLADRITGSHDAPPPNLCQRSGEDSCRDCPVRAAMLHEIDLHTRAEQQPNNYEQWAAELAGLTVTMDGLVKHPSKEECEVVLLDTYVGCHGPREVERWPRGITVVRWLGGRIIECTNQFVPPNFRKRYIAKAQGTG